MLPIEDPECLGLVLGPMTLPAEDPEYLALGLVADPMMLPAEDPECLRLACDTVMDRPRVSGGGLMTLRKDVSSSFRDASSRSPLELLRCLDSRSLGGMALSRIEELIGLPSRMG